MNPEFATMADNVSRHQRLCVVVQYVARVACIAAWDN